MKDERSRAAWTCLYPSSLTPDQVGLSAYFGDVANQKSQTMRSFGGFRFLETTRCIRTWDLQEARDSIILHCISLSKHFLGMV
jgi:hypothetical protein